MTYAEYCRTLRAELDRFVSLLADADLATAVPTCPGWDLARLVGHVGSTHRWVAAMVSAGSLDPLPFPPFRDAIPGDPTTRVAWLAEGAEELLATFAAVPADRPAWALGPDHHARFWPRRMLHEATVHHADASLALGKPPGIAPKVAADGIGEFLTNLPHITRVPGAAAVDRPGRTIAFMATDTGMVWRTELGVSGLSWSRADTAAGADAVVSAPVAGLYLFVYGRDPVVTITGDGDLLARWTAATAL